MNKSHGLRETKVYDTFWRFAAERQATFWRRFEHAPPPWSSDPILRRHKFTNVYRAADRVSQFLIRSVLYTGSQEPEELFFRAILFKLFNRIDTWKLLVKSIGIISYAEYRRSAYDRVLTTALEHGDRVYSGAYIMPSACRVFGGRYKHQGHLALLERMMDDEVPLRLRDVRTMREAFVLLRSYPSIGDFLAYQYVIDLNYSTLLNFSEMEFVVAGPGARSGIAKVFAGQNLPSEAEVIQTMADRQDDEFARLGLTFRRLGDRGLQLIDCQNLFCEVDKYSRIRHPDVASTRKRLKQRFQANSEHVDYWFPPKWGINDSIRAAHQERGQHGSGL